MKLRIHVSPLLKSTYVLLWFILLSGSVHAQKEKKDITKKDSTKTATRNFTPTGVRVGTDVLAIAKGYYKNSFNGWEVNGDIDFYRYLLAVEYGAWSNDIISKTSVYHNEGGYYRVGVDVNFLKKDPDHNIFFVGIRRGRSVFSETLTSQNFQPYRNTDVIGKWTELTAGLKVNIWKIFWMGYTARFKFRLRTSDTPSMLPHDVPGYGRTDKTTYWGFNYQLMVKIPLRKIDKPKIQD